MEGQAYQIFHSTVFVSKEAFFLAQWVQLGHWFSKEELNWNTGCWVYMYVSYIKKKYIYFLFSIYVFNHTIFSFCLLCYVLLCSTCVFVLFIFLSKNNTAYCCVLRGQRFIGQDTRADLWYVWCGSDPNDHLVNIWCCLTGMSEATLFNIDCCT